MFSPPSELSQQQQSDSRASDTHLSGSSTSSCTSATSEHEDVGNVPQSLSTAAPPAPETATIQPQAAPAGELDPINLVLRMRLNRLTLLVCDLNNPCDFNFRNVKRELNDIRFEFSVGRDSADGIASELVAAGNTRNLVMFYWLVFYSRVSDLTGLVDGRDLVVIAANLQKILDGLPTTTSVTFALVGIRFTLGIY